MLRDHRRCDRKLIDRGRDKVAGPNEKWGRELHMCDVCALDRIEAALLESVSWLVLRVDVFLGFVDVERQVSLDVLVVSDLACPVSDENESCGDATWRSEEGRLVDSGDAWRDRLKFSRELGEVIGEGWEETVSSALENALDEGTYPLPCVDDAWPLIDEVTLDELGEACFDGTRVLDKETE